MQTLGISMDYPRALSTRGSALGIKIGGFSVLTLAAMQQSFAIRCARWRGASFVSWFSRQLENRNHVAYVRDPSSFADRDVRADGEDQLDTQHNDIDTVHLNIFLNFALTSMKLPHYFDRTNEINKKQSERIYTSLCLAVEYTFGAGRARVRHSSRDDREKEHYAVKKRDFILCVRLSNESSEA
jgi:telomerase reverse transcriptase